ncbi:hypothetical protein Aph02nite_10100 [Actinoplanes philippinensis]|uniref:hypothetical protein n=1 Tax=Actinoplanes philippinensis TaxID=35752 RepID=UPI0011608A38|nr:hypothetical protein [Actinoplanes philippinensis]GIE75060.1 hypothetical protein Aph02nite_10100 [Actinoplanes philippinensis]
MTEPPEFSLPRWLPLAAATAVGVAGIAAAAAVACRRQPATVVEDVPELPPPTPVPPVERDRPPRSGGILLMIVAVVAAVWALMVICDDLNAVDCARARSSSYSVGSGRPLGEVHSVSGDCAER